MGEPAGIVCRHPQVTCVRGLGLGLCFTSNRPHRRCPLKGLPDDGVARKPVVGYEDRYIVDALGNVYRRYKSSYQPVVARNRHGKAPSVRLTDGTGSRKEHMVHLLVANAFLGPRSSGYSVCHRNGDRSDPSLYNLQVISKRTLARKSGGASRRRAVVKIDCASGKVTEVYASAREAGRANYMSYQTITDRCNGKCKSLCAPDGYVYRWDEDRKLCHTDTAEETKQGSPRRLPPKTA